MSSTGANERRLGENTMRKHLIATAALAAFVLGGAAATAQTPKEEVAAACHDDVARLCPNVPPGGGEVMQCLKDNKSKVSFGCKHAVFKAKEAKVAADNPAPPPPPPPH
jgi:hypothetical protein